MFENPLESRKEFIMVLKKVMLANLDGQDLLDHVQKEKVARVALKLLKANKVKPEEVGLILRFIFNNGDELEPIEGLDLPQILKQSLRIIYSNMHNVPIVDLAFSLDCLPVLQDY